MYEGRLCFCKNKYIMIFSNNHTKEGDNDIFPQTKQRTIGERARNIWDDAFSCFHRSGVVVGKH